MKIIEKTGNSYLIMGDSNKTYSVTETTCGCPAFKYIHKGLPCKHITFLLNHLKEGSRDMSEKILEMIRIGNNDFSDIENTFGSDGIDVVDYLKKKGEIIEYNGKLKIM